MDWNATPSSALVTALALAQEHGSADAALRMMGLDLDGLERYDGVSEDLLRLVEGHDAGRGAEPDAGPWLPGRARRLPATPAEITRPDHVPHGPGAADPRRRGRVDPETALDRGGALRRAQRAGALRGPRSTCCASASITTTRRSEASAASSASAATATPTRSTRCRCATTSATSSACSPSRRPPRRRPAGCGAPPSSSGRPTLSRSPPGSPTSEPTSTAPRATMRPRSSNARRPRRPGKPLARRGRTGSVSAPRGRGTHSE